MKKVSIGFLIVMTCLLVGCSFHYREGNDKAVERLRQQLLDERFDEIYEDSSSITREQLTRDEFVEKIRNATSELKAFDKDLKWRRDERGSPETAVYSDDNWSSFNMEKNGRQINVQLDWGPPFELCGMLISGDIPEGGIRVFRNCD